MKRMTILIAVLIVAATALALANEDPPIVQSGPAEATENIPVVRADTPLGLAIENLRAEAQLTIGKLAAKMPTAGVDEAVELQRQIATIKSNTEILILEAIIQDAVETGDQNRQMEAEAALERLQNPERFVPEAVPSNRPAPSR